MDDALLQPEQHTRALKGLSRLNFAAGTAEVFWRRLCPVMRSRPGVRWRLLDVATGGGDIPVRLWRLARRAGLDLQIVGCDLSEHGIRLAEHRARAAGADARFFRQDVLREPPAGHYDFVISSLFLHHLSEEESCILLSRLKAVTGRLLLVSDLRRNALGLAITFAATRLLTASPVVRVDGMRSVRAAYTIAEIHALAAAARLDGADVVRHWPARWLLQWSSA